MWTSAILTLVALNLMLIGWRSNVVRWLPQTASLYAAIGLPVNLRGLIFANVTTERETHDGVEVLVVQGSIVNNFQARRRGAPPALLRALPGRLRGLQLDRAAKPQRAAARASRCRSARGWPPRHARATASRCAFSTGAISAPSFHEVELCEVSWRAF